MQVIIKVRSSQRDTRHFCSFNQWWGEAPDNAIELHEFLQSKKAPKLSNLQYGVIGLGDSSYEFFCQTAKDFDNFLAKLGAKSFVDRLDCDVDYEESATEWRGKRSIRASKRDAIDRC